MNSRVHSHRDTGIQEVTVKGSQGPVTNGAVTACKGDDGAFQAEDVLSAGIAADPPTAPEPDVPIHSTGSGAVDPEEVMRYRLGQDEGEPRTLDEVVTHFALSRSEVGKICDDSFARKPSPTPARCSA